MAQLLENDFIQLIGSKIGPVAYKKMVGSNFRYQTEDIFSKEKLITEILKKVDANFWSIAGNKQKWEIGWGENYESYKNTNDREQLQPRFMLKDSLRRYNGEYIRPESNTFESDFSSVILYSIFENHLVDYHDVFDFGCGTGANLVKIADIFPNMKLHGLDWVQPAVDTLGLIKERIGLDVTGHLFDMFEPDYDLDVPTDSVIFTCGALEQIGNKFQKFLDFILYKKPAIIIHVEPIIEFYDTTKIMDYVAYKFHKSRGYLDGYYPSLVELENQNKIEILKAHRGLLGGLYHDSYSIVIWKIKRS